MQADEMEAEVLELVHEPPEFRFVPERHDKTRVARARRLVFDVADETGQYYPEFPLNNDLISQRVAGVLSHGPSR